MKNCPKCGTQLSDAAKFCGSCGENVEQTAAGSKTVRFCPKCGNQIPADARFCGVCGERTADAAFAAAPDTNASKVASPRVSRVPEPTDRQRSLSRALSIFLALLLVVACIRSVVRGAIYNAVTSLNAEKIETIAKIDEVSSLLGTATFFANAYYGSRIDESDITEAIANKSVKKDIQKIINSYADAVIMIDASKRMKTSDIKGIIKGWKSHIEELIGHTISSSDISEIADEIDNEAADLLLSAYGSSAQDAVEQLWHGAPGGLVMIRLLVLPATGVLLYVLMGLALVCLLRLNRNKLERFFFLTGVPAFIGGVSALFMRVLAGVGAGILADETELRRSVADVLFSGYKATAVSWIVWCLLIGGACLILRRSTAVRSDIN